MPYKVTNISRDPVSINAPSNAEDDLYLRPGEYGVVESMPFIPSYLKGMVVVETIAGEDIENTVSSLLTQTLPAQVNAVAGNLISAQSVSDRAYTDSKATSTTSALTTAINTKSTDDRAFATAAANTAAAGVLINKAAVASAANSASANVVLSCERAGVLFAMFVGT